MKTYPRLFQKLFCQPVLLHTPTRDDLMNQLVNRMLEDGAGIEMSQSAPQAMDSDKMPRRLRRIYTKAGNVAVITIDGVIDKRVSEFEMDCYGGCDLDDVNSAITLAAEDDDIEYVLLNIHSPGGSSIGVAETADRVAAIAQRKEVHAYTDTICCSAAYWIASQADVLVSSPSAIVGSIGVYIALLDQTKWMEMNGLKVELIKAGRLKAMGAGFKELTDEERDYLQSIVDHCYADFTQAVTRQRSLDAETMQGQWFHGKEATKLKLVDRTTSESIDEYVSRLASGR